MGKAFTKEQKEDIHKAFKPNRSPKTVFKEGAFGGTYFRDIKSKVTKKTIPIMFVCCIFSKNTTFVISYITVEMIRWILVIK